jgi:hypothetical protein
MMSRIIIRGTDFLRFKFTGPYAVDPDTFLIVPEGMVGELWTAGPGVGVG